MVLGPQTPSPSLCHRFLEDYTSTGAKGWDGDLRNDRTLLLPPVRRWEFACPNPWALLARLEPAAQIWH